MASCKRCNKDVGCSCNLWEGSFCNDCWNVLLQDGYLERTKEEKLVLPNTCGQSLEALEAKKAYVKQKYKDNKGKKLQYTVIINSQIKKFDYEPCRFFDKINKM